MATCSGEVCFLTPARRPSYLLCLGDAGVALTKGNVLLGITGEASKSCKLATILKVEAN